MVVKELKIWELAEKYGVTFTDSEREEIIASFLTRVVNENDFTTEVILKKAQIIMEGLSVNSSKSFHDFEYEILRSSTLDYEDRYVGEANDIICTIVNSCVSDASKKDYVYDNDIWELFEQYSVGLSKEEQVNILYRQFERLSLMNKTVPAERILKDLLPVVKALVATEHIEAKTSKKKTDKYLKQKLAQAGKELFCKAGIYGENIAEYTEYGFLFNSDHTREDVAWVFGDEKFDVLLNKLKVSIPKNDDYLDDVFLVYTYAIDNKKRAYTFFTHDHLYWVKEGKSVSSVAFKTFREVNSFGTITLKNGDSRYDVFLVKG